MAAIKEHLILKLYPEDIRRIEAMGRPRDPMSAADEISRVLNGCRVRDYRTVDREIEFYSPMDDLRRRVDPARTYSIDLGGRRFRIDTRLGYSPSMDGKIVPGGYLVNHGEDMEGPLGFFEESLRNKVKPTQPPGSTHIANKVLLLLN